MDKIKILIAGDFCPQERVSTLFERENFESPLGEVREISLKVDYAIVNLECPVTYGNENPIPKKGPNLQCSEYGIKAIQWAGFDGVTLANNHFLDYGEDGVKNTIDACHRYGLDIVGGGNNIREASEILYKKIKGKIVAVINCCEHEFSIATSTSAGSNPLNPIQQYYAIKEARGKADFVLVIVHGGHEYYQLPSPRMQETYRFFIDIGADAVINHHQHCFSGYEIYKKRPIFYGLGNFCFDKKGKRGDKWNDGYMVCLYLDETIEYDIFPYIQCSKDAKIVMLRNNNAFSSQLEDLNSIICDNIRLLSETDKYYASCTISHGNIFEPIYNKLYFAMKRRGLLPSFISKKRRLRFQNFIDCESHRDKVLWFLRNSK